MAGFAKKEDFLAKHKKCTLFMTSVLSNPEKKGWGKCLDKRSGKQALPGPYGRPRGHLWTGVTESQKEAKKKAPVIQEESHNDTSESVTKRINAVLRIASSSEVNKEATVRPKRKAAEKSPIIEEHLDDSDEDDHYKVPGDESSSDEDSGSASSDNNNVPAPKLSVKSSRGKAGRNIHVGYKAPQSIRELCQGQQKQRHEEMRKALAEDPVDVDLAYQWKPDAQDLKDEMTVFVARDMICQNNFGIASYELQPDSLARMKIGLEPLRKEDKEWVSRTPE